MTITGAVVRDNYLTGIAIDANGTVTLSNMEVIANGLGGDQNGIDVDTNGHNMLVQNSVISGNGKNGIYADLGWRFHTDGEEDLLHGQQSLQSND